VSRRDLSKDQKVYLKNQLDRRFPVPGFDFSVKSDGHAFTEARFGWWRCPKKEEKYENTI
jgi:hypothetical protein